MSALPIAKAIIGYSDEISVAPRESLSFFVHGDVEEGRTFSVSSVRLRGGGFDPGAPPLNFDAVEDLGTFPVLRQRTQLGSWGEVLARQDVIATMLREGSLSIWVNPALLGRRQVLVDIADGRLALMLDESDRPTLKFGQQEVAAGTGLVSGEWAVIVASWHRDGRMAVAVRPQHASNWDQADRSADSQVEAPFGGGRMLIGAGAQTNDPSGHADHFSGRLESPTLFSETLSPEQAVDAKRGDDAVLMGWDFAREIPTWTVPGHGRDAQSLSLRGAPKRGVRGHAWRDAVDWQEAPQEFAAIHFYADSLDDCAWTSQLSWTVPTDAPSGFYAARVETAGDVDFIPFFVRPDLAAAQPAPVLVVASTATYYAYANSRFWWEDPIQEVAQDRLVELGAEEQYLVTHPELGLSNYDLHEDETPVAFSSRRRPNLFMRPGHSRGESYANDLYMLSWLDHLGIEYDVITDEDLHFGGRAHLDRYAVALSGTHPEYMSIPMFDHIKSWVEDGGRFMYMGGNGFTSNVSWTPERPWLMENRTTGRLRGDPEMTRTEARHQLDGTLGLWMEESGRSTGSLFGVDSVTMGFDRSYPVSRTEISYAQEFEFAFAGIESAIFGGRSMSGGGVIGQEWDNARRMAGTAGHFVLASSPDHSLIPSILGAETPHHGDVVFFFHGQGLVFSVSSMAWVGALHIDEYDNDAERFTKNILMRFLDPAPIQPPREEERAVNRVGRQADIGGAFTTGHSATSDYA